MLGHFLDTFRIPRPSKIAGLACFAYLRSPPSRYRLIGDVLPFGRLWYGEPNGISNAIHYAKFSSRSHHAVIHVYDETGNVIEAHEHAGDFKEW